LLSASYAVFGGDSGHQGAPFDPRIVSNATAFLNYRHAAVKSTRDAAVYVEKQYYGTAPARTYFIGRSKGGGEAIVAALKYSTDYDGVVAYYPGINIGSMLSWHCMWQAAYHAPTGVANAGWMNPAKQALLQNKVLKASDSLDGASDGIVSNVNACNATFAVNDLRCPGSADTGDTCLSDAQINVLQLGADTWHLPYPLANGLRDLGRFPVYLASGPNMQVLYDAIGSGEATAYGAFVRGFLATNMGRAPGTMEAFDAIGSQTAVQSFSTTMDMTDPNIDAFKAKGGKMIIVQGTNDMLVQMSGTTWYWEQPAARYGDQLSGFAKYYAVPGFGNGIGDFAATWDAVSALEGWVERGVAPNNQVVIDATPANSGRSRPLCEYPKFPKYVSGDNKLAASYTCAAS
jgi:feruloyl esterase